MWAIISLYIYVYICHYYDGLQGGFILQHEDIFVNVEIIFWILLWYVPIPSRTEMRFLGHRCRRVQDPFF
jgi:hypothetical protein